MDTFRILREQTFNLRGGKIYLMLIIDCGLFGVEVVNRSESYGRKTLTTRAKADLLFKSFEFSLNECKDLKTAEDIIRVSLAGKSLEDIFFLLKVYGKKFSQTVIGEIVSEFKLAVNVKRGFLRDEKKVGAITITVSLNSKVIGRFFGTRYGTNFQFQLSEEFSSI